MPALKTGLAALLLLAGLCGPARAQKSNLGGATGTYPASEVTSGLSAYYGNTPNFANYGLSGTYPSHGGYGFNGYGPGPQFGAHFPASTAAKMSQPARKPASPMNPPPKKAARPGSFGDGRIQSLPLPRKGL